MSPAKPTHPACGRHGFALLIALITLVISSLVVAGMLAAARRAKLDQLAGERQLIAEDLLLDGERVACQWLNRHQATLCAPVGGGAFLLYDHRWTDRFGRPFRLAIALHDALSTLPRAALVAGHPLRLALTSPGSGPTLSGDITSIPPADLLGQVRLPDGWVRLPDGIPPDQPVGQWLHPSIFPRPVLAFWFSPDNAGVINANTAPANILRAAGPLVRIDSEAILNLRRMGKAWAGSETAVHDGLQLVAQSSRWNILLLVSIAQSTYVRWAVGDGSGGSFTIIRRHDASPASPSAPAP